MHATRPKDRIPKFFIPTKRAAPPVRSRRMARANRPYLFLRTSCWGTLIGCMPPQHSWTYRDLARPSCRWSLPRAQPLESCSLRAGGPRFRTTSFVLYLVQMIDAWRRGDDTTAVVDLAVDWFWACCCACSSGSRTLDCLGLAGEGAWVWNRRCVTNSRGDRLELLRFVTCSCYRQGCSCPT